jgi:hypothetical protein
MAQRLESVVSNGASDLGSIRLSASGEGARWPSDGEMGWP